MDESGLRHAYAEYGKLEGGEISFELSWYIVQLLKDLPENSTLVDLGSGWSSFLLRKFHPTAKVWSVDTDEGWMKKSIDFCVKQGVHNDGFVMLSKAKKLIVPGNAEFVLHDMGNRGVRQQELEWAVRLAKPGGIVLVDDMHKDDLRENVNQGLKKLGLSAVPVDIAKDHIGRYAYQIVNTIASESLARGMSSSTVDACIAAVKATGDWRANDCIKMLQECEDVKSLVLPVSMLHLVPVVQKAIAENK